MDLAVQVPWLFSSCRPLAGSQICDMTSDTCFKTTCSSAVAAFRPCHWWGETRTDGFPVGAQQQVKHMHSNPGRGRTSAPPPAGRRPRTAERAPGITLISLGRISLAVLEREQKGGGGWRQAEGGVNGVGGGVGRWHVALEGGGREGGAALRGPQAFVFLAHLWWGEKGGETRARSSGRTVTEVQPSPRRHGEPL